MNQILLDYRDLVIYFAAQQFNRILDPKNFLLRRIPRHNDFYSDAIEFYDDQDPPLRFRVYLRVEKYDGIRDFRLYEEPNYELTNQDEVYVAEGVGQYKLMIALDNYFSNIDTVIADYRIILTDGNMPLITETGEFIYW